MKEDFEIVTFKTNSLIGGGDDRQKEHWICHMAVQSSILPLVGRHHYCRSHV